MAILPFRLYGPKRLSASGHTPVHVVPAARRPYACTILTAPQTSASADPMALVDFGIYGPGHTAAFGSR